MAYATLEYNLDDPDDREAHARAVKADAAFNVLFEFRETILRPLWKYGDDEKAKEIAEELREKLWALISEAGIADLVE